MCSLVNTSALGNRASDDFAQLNAAAETTLYEASKKMEEAQVVGRKSRENFPLEHTSAVHWSHLLHIISRLLIEHEILFHTNLV